MFDAKTVTDSLEKRGDGIWYSKELKEVSYPSDGNQKCFDVEDSSFWFQHRNQCIVSMISKFHLNKNDAIFDIGGGNGFVSAGLLEAGFNPVLVEPGLNGIVNAKKRKLPNLICATSDSANFLVESIPAIGVFDVIEHIESDSAFLERLHTKLRPKGHIFCSVPAFQYLWSKEDDEAGHFRRYSKKSLYSLFESSGYEILFFTHIFRYLPIPIYIFRALPYKLGIKLGNTKEQSSNDHQVKSKITSKLLDYIHRQELKNIQQLKSMSFGGSCLLTARKI